MKPLPLPERDARASAPDLRRLDRRGLLLSTAGAALSVLAGCRASRAGDRAREAAPPAPLPAPAAPAEAAAPRPAEPPAAPEPALLPSPDLSDARVLRRLAGLRPFRAGGVRVEREELSGRTVLHDYGHGGSGFTLSWGCADEVLALALSAGRAPPEPALVLGAGVSGLTCAHRLASAGFRVRLLACDFPPHTTSDLAGAQWSPSVVDTGASPGDRLRFDGWLRRSYAAFAGLEGERYGVFRRPNYATRDGGHGLRAIPRDLIPPVEELARLPFAGGDRPGRIFHTFLIEPPRYLPALLCDLEDMGVVLEQGHISCLEAALSEPERVVVDALGLGAREVAGDPAVIPVRGQLVHVEPQALGYLLSHETGYLFARTDALVLGGTVERGVADPTPEPAACRRILAAHRRFFGLAG